MSNSVLIIGVGLIGGSIGLVLKKYSMYNEVIGFGRNKEKLKSAVRLGAIDRFHTDISNVEWQNISLVILCTPIKQIITFAKNIAQFLKENTIVTDVGSTKSEISEEINDFFSKNNIKSDFVGSHPIAGKEKTGVENASEILFQNAYCIVTPHKNNASKSIKFIESLWKKIGARVIIMSPEKHDLITGVISHLPHITASALVNTAGVVQKNVNDLLNFAAGGFKDITRIASSDENLWTQIITSNKSVMLSLIKEYKNVLNEFELNLINNDYDSITEFFSNSKNLRNSIRLKGTGLLLNYYDLEVVVEDRPGIIADITNTLSVNNINIKDIEILKYREYEDGILKLSFESEKNLNEAFKILNDANYEVKKR